MQAFLLMVFSHESVPWAIAFPSTFSLENVAFCGFADYNFLRLQGGRWDGERVINSACGG